MTSPAAVTNNQYPMLKVLTTGMVMVVGLMANTKDHNLKPSQAAVTNNQKPNSLERD